MGVVIVKQPPLLMKIYLRDSGRNVLGCGVLFFLIFFFFFLHVLNTFTDFVLHFLLEVKATGYLIKGSVTLNKIMDFSGFDLC